MGLSSPFLGVPCSSKKEGRRKYLSFKKSRYGIHVWITCMEPICMETISMEIPLCLCLG